MTTLGLRPDPALRTIAESRIVDQILLWGYAFEVHEGREAAAREAARNDLERWADQGLAYQGAEPGQRRFDPAEVLNFAIAVGQAGGDPFWRDCYVANLRRLVLDLYPSSAPRTTAPRAASLEPRAFHIRLERDYPLAGLAPGTRARLRLPLPLEGRALKDLIVEAHAPPESRVVTEVGRIDVRLTTSDAPLATLAIDAAFIALAGLPGGEALSDEDRALYTNPKEGLICVSPRVKALAAELAGGQSDAATLAARFHEHMLDHFSCGAVHYHQIGAEAPSDWPLETGWMDCQVGAALFCALCRARGLPARIVSGFQLYGALCAYHYWSEVWIEGGGWTPFDLAAWRLSMGGRDRAWRDMFTGAIDYRMKVQVLPRIFTGPSSIRFPDAWHMVTRLLPGGVEIAFEDVETGSLVYRERLFVRDRTAAG
jgi:hypothetical protein